jgi:hypothetical protein
MGTVAATVSRNRLAAGPITHGAVNSALTAGFSSAFEVAGLFAIFGFVAALVAIRHQTAPAVVTSRVQADIAA